MGPFSIIPARTGIGSGHQHERGRVFQFHPQPGDGDLPVFQRAPERLDGSLGHLRQLVQEEHSVVGQGDFPGKDVVAPTPADNGRQGSTVMGCAERPFADESEHLAAPLSRHRINFAGLEGLFRGHGRQNPRQGPCQGAFPGARSADHYQVVSPGRGNFNGPLGPFLPDDVGEIHARRSLFLLLGLALGLPETTGVPDKHFGRILFLFQDGQHIGQRLYPEEQGVPVLDRLHGRPGGQDGSRQALFHRQFHHGQRTRHLADRSVQTQLSHDNVASQSGQVPLPRSRDDSQGDGHVIPAPAFGQVGRRQVDDNFLSRHAETH